MAEKTVSDQFKVSLIILGKQFKSLWLAGKLLSAVTKNRYQRKQTFQSKGKDLSLHKHCLILGISQPRWAVTFSSPLIINKNNNRSL